MAKKTDKPVVTKKVKVPENIVHKGKIIKAGEVELPEDEANVLIENEHADDIPSPNPAPEKTK